MGQIITNKPIANRCNLVAIESGGSKASTILKEGEIWLVDTSNATKIGGFGRFDSYIVGDGVTAAGSLTMRKIDDNVDLDSVKDLVLVKYKTESAVTITTGEVGDYWIQGEVLKICTVASGLDEESQKTTYAVYETVTPDTSKLYMYGNVLYRYVDNAFEQVGEQGPQGEKGDTGEQGPQGPQGIQGNTGISVGDNWEAFSTLEALSEKTSAEKKAMLSDGEAIENVVSKQEMDDLEIRKDSYPVVESDSSLGVGLTYTSTQKRWINSAGQVYNASSTSGSSNFYVVFIHTPFHKGDIYHRHVETSSSTLAAKTLKYIWVEHKLSYYEDLINVVGEVAYDKQASVHDVYAQCPYETGYLVYCQAYTNLMSNAGYKVWRNPSNQIVENTLQHRNLIKEICTEKNTADIGGYTILSGLQINNDGEVVDRSEDTSASSYRVVYINSRIPKGTLIRFTASSTAKRTQVICYSLTDPSTEDALNVGTILPVVNIRINGEDSWEEEFFMPETAWLVYYYYNSNWSSRIFNFWVPSHIPEGVENNIENLERKVLKIDLLDNFLDKYVTYSRHIIRGSTGLDNPGKYGPTGAYYTTDYISTESIDTLACRLPYTNSTGSSAAGGSVALLAAYDSNKNYLPEDSIIITTKQTYTGTWTKGENVAFVRFTINAHNANSGKAYTYYASVPGSLEERLESLENIDRTQKTINELNEDRECIIKQCQNSKTYTNPLLRLVHFSDLHGDTTRLKRIIEWCDEHDDMIDDIINTGDVVKDKFSDGNPYGTGTNIIPGAQYILTAIGNHDCASKFYPLGSTKTTYDWYARRGSSSDGSDTKVYNRFIKPYIKTIEEDPETGESIEVNNWGVTQPDGAEENGYTWYYKDYAGGYRLIVLDSMNYTSGTGQAAVDDINFGVQRAWYKSVLEDARQKNLSVITAYHFLYRARHGIKTNMMPWGIANGSGYSNQSITGSTTASSSTADYVKSYSNSAGSIINDTQDFIDAGGKFICHLVGHSHGDRIFYAGSQANRDGSIPTKQIAIMVDAACCTSSANHYGSIRVAKGRAQDSFNYVCFDKNAQRITIVKIGVDANVYGQHVDWTSVYYGGDKAEQYMQVGNTTYTSEEYLEPDHDDDGDID